MKYLLTVMLVLSGSMSAWAQLDALPDSPLDTSMDEAIDDEESEEDFQREQEQERQEELLENRYDVPEDRDEEKFNLNGTNDP